MTLRRSTLPKGHICIVFSIKVGPQGIVLYLLCLTIAPASLTIGENFGHDLYQSYLLFANFDCHQVCCCIVYKNDCNQRICRVDR